MPNPYLTQQADNIASNMTRNFNTNVLPQINQGAMAAGGFGGSRQGIAQGLGMRGLNDSIGQAQTSLYSNAYNTDQQIQSAQSMQAASLAAQQRMAEMQDATNRLGLNNSFNLGMGGLGLNAMTANQNFYNTQRGLDISQMGLGRDLTATANTGLTNQGSQLTQLGQTQQNAPWQALGNYANTLSPFSGLGQSSSVSTPGASTAGSALGGALTAAQLWKLFGG